MPSWFSLGGAGLACARGLLALLHGLCLRSLEVMFSWTQITSSYPSPPSLPPGRDAHPTLAMLGFPKPQGYAFTEGHTSGQAAQRPGPQACVALPQQSVWCMCGQKPCALMMPGLTVCAPIA